MNAAITYSALVGVGGFIGALARYGLAGILTRQFPTAAVPIGTLVVNMLGCFLIGILAGLLEEREVFGPEFRTFAFIGILGGFTTYSTFGLETFALLRDAEILRATFNVVVHVVAGIALVWLGFYVATFR